MSASKRIDQRFFLTISREIKARVADKRYDTKKLASYFDVSETTINTVKRVKTWPAFKTYKQARQAKRGDAPKDTSAEKQLAKGLANQVKSPSEYVTVKQFEKAMEDLGGRIGVAKGIAVSADKNASIQGGILNTIIRRKPGWFRERS
ncbi:hypothetical protein QN355_11645 [Cryobacterium sp. 10S3]|uniref:hypothetical protein n=1 Tax=Cryobacterium sp. 10S3 TaxID=3048582 RepID=UPI002AC983DC|nr:hypothetical protein [Cryobacterium sp. 10S3]MEB0287207.1 hypothetical protein [Cryobacterium sp. 10S3]WPX14162.1 hypothetical protein RHM57_01965 [Cryobacterium sp. 10S3]